MSYKIDSAGFVKVFKAINIKLQKKLSKKIAEIIDMPVEIYIKECGLKDILTSDKIFIRFIDSEKYFLFSSDKIFAKAIAGKLIEGEMVLSEENLSKSEKNIFVKKVSFNIISFYLELIFQQYIEKDEYDFSVSENPVEEFFDGEKIAAVYSEFETVINQKKMSFSFYFPVKFFKDKFENIDIKKIMEEKNVSLKIDYQDIPLEMRVIFGKRFIKAEEINSISEGSVIKLDKTNASDVEIVFDNGPVLKGLLGKIKNKLAVKVNL